MLKIFLLLRLPEGRGGVVNSAILFFFLFFFFRCRKLGYRSWVMPLLNSISSEIYQQNAHFNMYTTTSKHQEGSTCKDSHLKCFKTTNSTAKLWRGVINPDKVLRACFHHFPLCFHLNFSTSFRPIFYRNIFTKHKF